MLLTWGRHFEYSDTAVGRGPTTLSFEPKKKLEGTREQRPGLRQKFEAST
jgi:hypothetical protein